MPDFNSMTESELLMLTFAYKNFIESEPDTMFSELFRERVEQIEIALAKKRKAALQGD
jgi:hypothetical protein